MWWDIILYGLAVLIPLGALSGIVRSPDLGNFVWLGVGLIVSAVCIGAARQRARRRRDQRVDSRPNR